MNIVSQFRFSTQNKKSDHCSSVSIVFKAQNKNWLLIDQFFLDFDNLHVIFTRNQNPTILARPATIVVGEFLRQTEQSGWLIASFFFGGGGGGFPTAFCVTVHQKALYQRPWKIRPRRGPWKKSKLS
jgi:hypothetical protein